MPTSIPDESEGGTKQVMEREKSTGKKAVEIAYLSVLMEEDVNHRTKKAFSEMQRKGELVHLNTFQ